MAFIPLYILGFMGMPRRMQHFDNPDWQPYLIVAALGTLLILCGIGCTLMQLVVSIRDRKANRDLTGDPWNGRTLEWLTASPPAVYNFAVIPVVHDRDAFWHMKEKGTAYLRPERYEDIEMPRNTACGLAVGALAFVVGFCVIWNIWWLACLGLVGLIAVLVARSLDENATQVIPAAEVERIEGLRALGAR
jgi:cytochrome o ubiquinol oxidase subunit 1